ncbi:MAG: protein-tyrosine-phosphatase [Deltaproteobacteria bacterium]|nr:protein-tyrosine-phosphatase [Nannocystaceae bacterium]
MRAGRTLAALLLASCVTRPPEGAATSERASPGAAAEARAETTTMNAGLTDSIEALVPSLDALPAERKRVLDRVAAFVSERRSTGQPARLTFICTANSRRSHLGQLWAAAAAAYYGVDGVETYSGGTEATAFNPRAIAAIERAGFVVDTPTGPDDNPHYRVRYAQDKPAILSFSKRYDEATNPKADFVAVMTCSEADQNCPLVPGAALRVSLSYEDPKVADGTPEEAARYDERSRQIATEMLYLFSRVAAASKPLSGA